MRIVIDTDGSTKNTAISINGKDLSDLKEFHFSMNHTRNKGNYVVEGKCKMQHVYPGDFRSYYGDDFKKFNEILNSKES